MNKLIEPKIRLEELTHTYLLDDPEDISFTSVTTFIGQFFDEFDAEKIATKLVRTHPRYKNTTVDELLAKWKSQTDRGQKFIGSWNYILKKIYIQQIPKQFLG